MKNTTAILTSYLPGKFTSRKTIALNKCEIALNSFRPKRNRAALIVNAILLMFLTLSLMSDQANAASFNVNLATDAYDVNPGNGVCDSNPLAAGAQCTLRAAIEESNAFAGTDDISFSLPLPSVVELTLGQLFVNGNVSINGPGARSLSVERSALAPNFRIFEIQSGNLGVSINGISIVNGRMTEGGVIATGGAGIQNLLGSALNLTEVTVRNNYSGSGSGGGINNLGTLNITRSTISGNTAVQGAGVSNSANNSVVNISNSTISGNTTIPGENVLALGGGLKNNATMTLNNVTVTNNSGTRAGGIYNPGAGTVSIRNSIVAGNPIGHVYPDLEGAFSSQGNNLIGASDGSTGFTNNVNGDKVGTEAMPLNPQIGGLQSNGGQTDTHRLLPGSPAIDAGNNCVTEPVHVGCLLTPLTTDQRGAGFSRKLDGDNNGTAIIDIGAFEATVTPTAASVTVGGRVRTADGRGIKNVIVTITFPSGEQHSVVSGALGYYRFSDVPAGESYVFSATAKRYSFSQPSQLRNIAGDDNGIDFIAVAPVFAANKITEQ